MQGVGNDDKDILVLRVTNIPWQLDLVLEEDSKRKVILDYLILKQGKYCFN